ncbi:MAG TPA: hypothetical protein ENK18_03590 [Deltaproteobacteria bacterium]|nr:hypothetical protein [Deltaproteobacteria bacterium]
MIVVGAGRVGTALQRQAQGSGLELTLIDRHRGWEALDAPQGDPVLLAVRNDDLTEVIGRIPSHRRSDLVFLQNGAIRELLAEHALAGSTRGLLYLMVSSRTAPLVSGGTSWLCGPHALAVVRLLGALSVPAEAVDWARFSYYELEKLLWLAAHGLLCEALDATVDRIAAAHVDALTQLVVELAAVGRAAWGVQPDPAFLVQRMLDYSASIPGYRASVKEWPWRNGWLVAAAQRYGVATPHHTALLVQTGHLPRPAIG